MLVNQTMAVKGAAPKTASDYGKIFGAPEDEMYFAAALNPKFEVDGAKNGIRKFTGQRKQFYTAMVVLALGAAVQGMDETVINGAQTFFFPQFGIKGMATKEGIVNGAPYLCCGLLGCWLTIPINKVFGRRGAILLASFIQLAACIGQACTSSWQGMLIARLILGLGIGVNSATVPMFAAEVAPAHIRGAIGMLWQFFTAFGIMLGNAVCLALFKVPNAGGIGGFAWRLMMGSPAVIALVICVLAPFCPESPRWLMGKGEYAKAYVAMGRLRPNKYQTAGDCIRALLYVEQQQAEKTLSPLQTVASMIKNARNRRALYASELVMFTQQFCGVNLIAYYSTMILRDADFSEIVALSCSFALGATNFFGAIPAFFVIDRFGRRPLLLWTLPIMGLFLAITGGSFFLEGNAKIATTLFGLLAFMISYSPGPGPVPFPYCAEVWPNEIRPIGMSLNTATTWTFNFILSFTFPSLRESITTPGVFFYYAGWCFVLTLLVFCFVRESKGLELEDVDRTFQQSTCSFVAYSCKKLWCRLLQKDRPTLLADRAVEMAEETMPSAGPDLALESARRD